MIRIDARSFPRVALFAQASQGERIPSDPPQHANPREPRSPLHDETPNMLGLAIGALIVNLIALLVIVQILELGLVPFVSQAVVNFAPCVSPNPRAAAFAITLLLLTHIVIDFVPRQIEQLLKGLGRPVGISLRAIIEALHPRALSARGFWIIVVILGATAWYVSTSDGSPLLIAEPTPNVENFVLKYPGSAPRTYQIGETVPVSGGQLVTVEATISDAAGAKCEWSNRPNTWLPAPPCATQFSSQFAGVLEHLTVHVESRCKSKTTVASVHMDTKP